MPNIRSEAQLQAACHQHFHNTYPHLRGLGFMIHNDGVKSKITAAADKARGLVAGVPDWCLMVPALDFWKLQVHGLFIEFKFDGGTLSAAQREVQAKLVREGYRVEVVRDLERFQAILKEYLS